LDNSNYIEILGLVAAVLTTGSFLPQVYQTWKTKDVSGLSLPMLVLFFIGISLWFIYGFLKDSPSLIGANGISMLSFLLLIYYKIKHGKKES
jgi:MtN3 and saliva related transmembrane protein